MTIYNYTVVLVWFLSLYTNTVASAKKEGVYNNMTREDTILLYIYIYEDVHDVTLL